MREGNDKENDLSLATLEFKKKEKARPKTERTSSSSTVGKYNSCHEGSMTLIEKKKLYSKAIR